MAQPEILQAIHDLGRKFDSKFDKMEDRMGKMEQKLEKIDCEAQDRMGRMEEKLEKIDREAQEHRKQETDQFNHLCRQMTATNEELTRVGERIIQKMDEFVAEMKACNEL